MRILNSQPSTTSFETETEPTPIARGAKGDHVKTAQNRLLDAGYSLTRYGADGQFGSETAAALARFQKNSGIPSTGQFDAATFSALQNAPDVSVDYAAMTSDGRIDGVLAVGYDEANWHETEVGEVRRGLQQRGFTPITDAQRTELNLDDAGEYVMKKTNMDGKDVTVVLELVDPSTPNAKDRFAHALRNDELVMYGGHGRYGSGPDFDDIRSPAGNFVIGAPFEAGHVTLGANDLSAEKLTTDYQAMFFDGCNTYRYLDDLRARTPGKTAANLDVIGSTTELYWDDTAKNLLAMLDSVTKRESLPTLRAKLDEANDLPNSFVGDGFDDNVR